MDEMIRNRWIQTRKSLDYRRRGDGRAYGCRSFKGHWLARSARVGTGDIPAPLESNGRQVGRMSTVFPIPRLLEFRGERPCLQNSLTDHACTESSWSKSGRGT